MQRDTRLPPSPTRPCPAPTSAARHLDAARLFESSARRFGELTALVADEDTRSYSQLLERTGRIAQALLSLGVEPGHRVVLLLPNGIDFIECWWGVVRAGACVVPVSARATPEDLLKVLTAAGAAALIVGEPASAHALVVRERLPQLRVIGLGPSAGPGVLSLQALTAEAEAVAEAQPRGLDDPCAMYFTAGSTGQPKGVLRSHQSVVWGLSMLAQRLRRSDVLLARAPMAHTGGSLTGPFAVLVAGGTLVLPAGSSVPAILDSVARHRVTHLYVHPTVFAKGLLAHLTQHPVDLGSLQRLQWTAGPLPEPVRQALFDRFPRLPLEVTYGMTEASNIAAYEYLPGATAAPKAAHCVGYPLPGAEIRIADAEGRPLAPGSEGEIVIRTPTAFDGYWNAPAETAAALTPDAWIRTGDVGFLDADGALHLNGRRREIIKTGGMAVHPAEVEQALTEHPRVVDAAVFGQPHPEWDEAVVAAVSLCPGEEPVGAAQLVAHCRTRLAGYKLPKAIHILAELPRNGSGKVDKLRVIALVASTTASTSKDLA